MAIILTKKSDTASSVPTSGALTNSSGGAEIAVNTADKRLFTKDSGGTVVELGTNPSSLSLPNGTANAVPYLNGSKVLTSGSALTFDGTSLNVNTAGMIVDQATLGSVNIIHAKKGDNVDFSRSPVVLIENTTATGSINHRAGLLFNAYNSSNASTSAEMRWESGAGLAWYLNASENMRLTSTGLGIGTSSPARKLDVNGSIQIPSNNALYINGSNNYLYADTSAMELASATQLKLVTNGALRATLDSAGNLGLGVTPSAWGTSRKAFQVGTTGAIEGGSSVELVGVISNAYINSANNAYNYVTSAAATRYFQNSGQHIWQTAPSGTAGNAISFTQAMTLDANGALTVIKDGSFQGVTVGRGAGSVATNTAVGASALAANTTGGNNVAVGNGAAASNTTGNQITAIGKNSVYTNTTGNYNIGIGENSLYYNTTGSYNVGVGPSALQSNTTASNNTAVGYQAGYSNTTGNRLAAFGMYALNANTTGVESTAVGYNSLAGNTTGNYNVAVGRDALALNTTASNNTAVGYQAGYSNTTGYDNTALGFKALIGNTTGTRNVALGQESLYNVTATNYNIAIGYRAMVNQSGGDNNIAIGGFALQSTGGSSNGNNVAIGFQSLYSNTTGSNNVSVGHTALVSNTTASNNTAVGYQAGYNSTGGSIAAFGYNALYANTTGAYNVAVGSPDSGGTSVMRYNTTGSYNTALGGGALASNTTASLHTAVGYQAGYSNTTGERNTFIGNKAGYAVTTGGGNTFVGGSTTGAGNGAGAAVTTGSKNTIIGSYDGNQGGLDIRTASNYIVLSDGDGNPRLVGNGSGSFGAGVAPSPWGTYYPSFEANPPSAFSWASRSNEVQVTAGLYQNNSFQHLYATTGQAAVKYSGSAASGIHSFWATTSTGTAGNVISDFTQVLSFGKNSSVALQGATGKTGTGITFPATQNASSDANTLDDYEEGTWTPALEGSISNPTVGYSNQQGVYTKVGNVVTVGFKILTSSFSGGSGGLRVAGLPFTVKSPTFNAFTGAVGYTSNSFPSGYQANTLEAAAGASFLYVHYMDTNRNQVDIPIGTGTSSTMLIEASITYIASQ